MSVEDLVAFWEAYEHKEGGKSGVNDGEQQLGCLAD